MPTIKRFPNCTINMYPDHAPPHFHIIGAGFEALVRIDTLEVLAGSARKAREAMESAALNKALLMAEWLKLNKSRS